MACGMHDVLEHHVQMVLLRLHKGLANVNVIPRKNKKTCINDLELTVFRDFPRLLLYCFRQPNNFCLLDWKAFLTFTYRILNEQNTTKERLSFVKLGKRLDSRK